MSAQAVLWNVDEERGVATITFNRPEVLNAVDVPTAQAFLAAVQAVTASPGVRAILISGEGRAFVAGGDISAFGSDPGQAAQVVNAILDAMHPALLALREHPAPVIASVRGAAAGAGLSLVLSADLVICDEGARFVIAYDRLGATPDCGATWFLARKVGRTKATELFVLSEALGAAEAKAAGLVSKVVPSDELATQAEALASKVARGPTLAYGGFNRLMDSAMELDLADQLETERALFMDMIGKADFREGVSAFLEKRKPVFSGA
ncbi:enoyl-CoA hydratase-related protein [Breoghania sp.]|uniref:enoyl-CoA hydratase/isomerase family protein n=1 Tax=Breoghania sp. TaxID=2065378 RepID=UPI002AA67DD0|nr:enoyl-CoA hydratase-related protein [Breoghania sp.]